MRWVNSIGGALVAAILLIAVITGLEVAGHLGVLTALGDAISSVGDRLRALAS